MHKIIVGSRGSELAMAQAHKVCGLLKEGHPGIKIEIKKIKTSGDKLLGSFVQPDKNIPKGLFVKELEEALLRKDIDIAVHSMKDLPTEIPDGLMIGAVLKRDNPYDVLISRDNLGLKELPRNAKIGTSSPRRAAQLLDFRGDFKIIGIRGNLTTRLGKLQDEALDALVVAECGMRRLGLETRITERIDFDIMVPAVAQGAIGAECREENVELVRGFEDYNSRICIEAERAFLKEIGGGCQIPAGALARIFRTCPKPSDENRTGSNKLRLRAAIASEPGSKVRRMEREGDVGEYLKLGREMARGFENRFSYDEEKQ